MVIVARTSTLDGRLVASLFVFVALLLFQYPAQMTSGWLVADMLASISLFVVLVLLYCYRSRAKSVDAVFNAFFCAYVALALLFFAANLALYPIATFLNAFYFISHVAILLAWLLAVFLLLSAGIYLMHERRRPVLGILCFAVALFVLYIYILSPYAVVHAVGNDEELIAAHGVGMMLNGTNPYSQSLSGALYSENLQYNTGYTLTTNNTIIGTMDYPALFFLSFAPFYFLSNFSVPNLLNIDLPIQCFVFLSILLFTIWCLIGRKDPLAPKPLLYLSISLLVFLSVSITTYLMLAVILIAYLKLDSRYSWVILGIAASLQEELWIPVALLVAYSANTYGLRKGAYCLFGTVLVFLIFNGYFIAADPSAYINSVMSPINGFILPNAGAPVGYFLSVNYHSLVGAFPIIFMIALAGVIMISLYFNNKKAIPLLCVIPFIFSAHGLTSYYCFFFAMFVVILYSDSEREREGEFHKAARKNRVLRHSLVAMVPIILAGSALLVLGAHDGYTNGLDLSISGQSVFAAGNVTHYYGVLTYNPDAGKGAHILIETYYGYVAGDWYTQYYGLDNKSLLRGAVNCSYPCSINTNVIPLNSPNGTYVINATVHDMNISVPVYVSAFVYSGQYAYQSAATEIGAR